MQPLTTLRGSHILYGLAKTYSDFFMWVSLTPSSCLSCLVGKKYLTNSNRNSWTSDPTKHLQDLWLRLNYLPLCPLPQQQAHYPAVKTSDPKCKKISFLMYHCVLCCRHFLNKQLVIVGYVQFRVSTAPSIERESPQSTGGEKRVYWSSDGAIFPLFKK